MSDVILFAILGLGAGSVYALLALGIVLIQKGTGAINFAHGAIAGCAAIYFGVSTDQGTPKFTAALLAILAAGVLGLVFFLLVMRPLRHAPLLARITTTLGLMLALQGVATKIWAVPTVIAPPIFPAEGIEVFGVLFGRDRLYLVATAILLSVGLWVLFRFTRFGVATRAAAENERGAALLGYSPDVIGAASWVLGSMLAALAGVLFAPLTALSIDTLSLLVVPALAAALVGRFSSFGVTTATALGLGMAQSIVTRFWTQPGVTDALPFVLIVVLMVVAGQLIPGRGARATGRLPLAPDVRRKWVPAAILTAVPIIGLMTLSGAYQTAILTTLVMVILALSVVIVTGFSGQISLMQMAFAGLAAFAVSKFALDLGIPFPLPILLGALIVVPVGVLLGLPSLRVRGMALAVVTLGAAVAVSRVVFSNPEWTGGGAGSQVPSPELFGWSLDPSSHPIRFGVFATVVTVLLIVGVMNVRTSAFGRRLLAVRNNERAASAVGINVALTKLQAFALSAFVAGVGGGVLAYLLGAVAFTRFVPLASILLIATVYIGGIASVYGAVVSGVIANGAVLYVLLTSIDGVSPWWITASGVLLMFNAVIQPDGIAVAIAQQVAWVKRRLSRKPPGSTRPSGSSAVRTDDLGEAAEPSTRSAVPTS